MAINNPRRWPPPTRTNEEQKEHLFRLGQLEAEAESLGCRVKGLPLGAWLVTGPPMVYQCPPRGEPRYDPVGLDGVAVSLDGVAARLANYRTDLFFHHKGIDSTDAYRLLLLPRPGQDMVADWCRGVPAAGAVLADWLEDQVPLAPFLDRARNKISQGTLEHLAAQVRRALNTSSP